MDSSFVADFRRIICLFYRIVEIIGEHMGSFDIGTEYRRAYASSNAILACTLAVRISRSWFTYALWLVIFAFMIMILTMFLLVIVLEMTSKLGFSLDPLTEVHLVNVLALLTLTALFLVFLTLAALQNVSEIADITILLASIIRRNPSVKPRSKYNNG